MKTKKVLGSIFASLLAVSSIAALASCDKDVDNGGTGDIGGGETSLDQQAVQNAIDTLNVNATVTSDFELTINALGGVAISWSSSNVDVISISGNKATVTRPFGGTAATVTLKATAVLNDVTISKEFAVTVSPITDESKTVAEIKELSNSTITIAKGVVTGLVYAAGTSDPEYVCGYYLTDATGTIYVYDTANAATLSVGNEVYLSATKGERSSAVQLSSVSSLQIINEEATPDFSTATKDKTVSEISSLGAAACGNVYEFTAVVDKSTSYPTYYLQDPANTSNSILVFFSGSASNGNVYEFDDLVEDKVGMVVKVRYVVNSLNSSSRVRGTILELLPLSVEEQESYIETTISKSVEVEDKITSATTISLPTTFEGYDKTTVAWSLASGSTGATIENNVLTITPTDTLQQFTLVASVTIEGSTKTIEVKYENIQVKNSFDPISYEEYLQTPTGSSIYIQGIIVAYTEYSTQHGNVNLTIQDETKGGYYLYRLYCDAEDVVAGGKYAIGTLVKVSGVVGSYNGQLQLTTPVLEVISTSTVPAAENITNVAEADLINHNQTLVSIDQLYYNGSTLVTVSGVEYELGNLYVTQALEKGKVYSFNGLLGYYSGYTLYPLSTTSFVELTSNVDVKFIDASIKGLFELSYTAAAEVEVPVELYGNTITYAVTSGTVATYASGKVSILASTGNATLAYYLNGSSEQLGSIEIDVDLTKRVNTISHSDTSTSNFKENVDYAQNYGLNATYLSLTSQKNNASTHVGVNKDGTFRLYAKKEDGNGTSMIIAAKQVSGCEITIESIDIDFGSTVGAFKVNGTVGSKDITHYDINSNQAIIQNVQTEVTTQVWIKSIIVTYKVVETGEPISYELNLNLNGGKLNDGVETKYTVSENAENKSVTLPTAADFASAPYGLIFLGWSDGTNMITTTTVEVTSAMTLTAVYDTNISIAKALEICTTTGETATTLEFTVTGTIASIDSAYSETYKNITITLTDGTNSISCFRVAGGSDLAAGDTITLTGKLINYRSTTSQFNTGATYVKATN